jgi:hypothetical protein
MTDFSKFPIAQMKILLRLWDSADKMGFAEGRDEGGSVKELYRGGFVTPAGKVGRRIRWKLVGGKLSSTDISFMRRLVTTNFLDFVIEDWSKGFQIVPGTLTSICSFIVRRDDFIAGFAFHVGFLDWVSKKLKNDEMVAKTKDIIKTYIDEDKVKHLDELTFEYLNSNFVEVKNPDWWIKSK